MINIDELIKISMKAKNQVELRTYKNLKAEIQTFKTAKNAKPYDEVAEISIIKKYREKLEKSILSFSEACREDLVTEYSDELEVLRKLLPKPVNESDIEYILYNWADEENFMDYSGSDLPEIKIPKKEMGRAIKYLKSKFPQADGKVISEIVKRFIK